MDTTQLLLLQDINNKMNSVIPQLTKKIKKIEEKNRNLEKEICDLKKYINSDKCTEPILLTNDSKNVGIYISISRLNELKTVLIEQLVKHNNLCLGRDSKFISENIVYQSIKHFIVDDQVIYSLFGEKIYNFNGRWENNYSKIGFLLWLSESTYDYAWYLEDDVYLKDSNDFFIKYIDNTEDLICTIEFDFPDWYYNRWKVGSIHHGIGLSHLYVCRFSKLFAQFILKQINLEKELSHHEIFIPYCLSLFKGTHSSLEKEDLKFLRLGNDQNDPGYRKNFIDNQNTNIAHPVKKF